MLPGNTLVVQCLSTFAITSQHPIRRQASSDDPVTSGNEDADDGDKKESYGQTDSHVEQGPFHTTSRAINPAAVAAAENTTQTRALTLGLSQDHRDQCDGDDDLDDLYIDYKSSHNYPPTSTGTLSQPASGQEPGDYTMIWRSWQMNARVCCSRRIHRTDAPHSLAVCWLLEYNGRYDLAAGAVLGLCAVLGPVRGMLAASYNLPVVIVVSYARGTWQQLTEEGLVRV